MRGDTPTSTTFQIKLPAENWANHRRRVYNLRTRLAEPTTPAGLGPNLWTSQLEATILIQRSKNRPAGPPPPEASPGLSAPRLSEPRRWAGRRGSPRSPSPPWRGWSTSAGAYRRRQATQFQTAAPNRLAKSSQGKVGVASNFSNGRNY